ncbi:NACHT domain-containing protein [Streptomyces sp. NPDC088261]|uniref:NACHT domain-containing protein n=1 Tax=Streptomyces sp. NPDC088261 TaxID=3365851 RepID=UPI003823A446
MAATLIALAPTVSASYVAWAAYQRDHTEAAADVEAKTRTLAGVVMVAETRQRAQLIGEGAKRIDLAFGYRRERANNTAGAAPEGHLTEIVAYYRALSPARLVITGEPGAGKTLLALELLLGLLAGRADTDPVPVRFSLAGWDTARPLREWLAEQVHDRLRYRGITVEDARLLVDEYRVLPVLDGLDEMDADTTPAGRRRATEALAQLNAYQDPVGSAPVVLTCRTAQYDHLVARDVRMREAARVEIHSVDAAQAAAYLMARTTDPDRWAPVLHVLTAEPAGPVATALSTPWQLNLAAAAFEQRHPDTLAPVSDPAELLAFTSPEAVHDHLLAAYLPAATGQHPTRPGRYRPEQVHRWLATLATHLGTSPAGTSGAGTDLVLHQLWPQAGSRRVRTVDALLAALLILPLLLLTQTLLGFSPHQVLSALPITIIGLVAIQRAGRSEVPQPRTRQLHRLRDRAQRGQLVARVLRTGLTVGIAVGGAVGIGPGLNAGFDGGPAHGITVALSVAFSVALAVGVAAALSNPLGDPTTTTAHRSGLAAPTRPTSPVLDDLVAGVLGGFVGGAVFVASLATVSLAAGLVFTLGLAIVAGLVVGPVLGIYYFTGAGRRYVVYLCCSRGRLPWRLGPFLDWSYEAGLLRISGIAYQFRHRELQNWLATHPTP